MKLATQMATLLFIFLCKGTSITMAQNTQDCNHRFDPPRDRITHEGTPSLDMASIMSPIFTTMSAGKGCF